MNRRTLLIPVIIILLTLLVLPLSAGALAESYEAHTMRLLRYDGDVEILNPEGVPRFVMEDVRFDSGESMRTGEESIASVGMDDSKIVTLDAQTAVQFIQESGHMLLKLQEGALFVDVSEKLDENESFDIETTTLTVGIRGTLVFAESRPSGAGPSGSSVTSIGVLEGTAQIDYRDTSGSRRVLSVPAGKKVSIAASPEESAANPVVSEITSADIAPFIVDHVLNDDTLTNRVVEGSPNGADLLSGVPSGGEETEPPVNLHPADGDWIWTGTVRLVAQSASKLYDGHPLSRPGGVLVSGLPEDCSIQVSAVGSCTDAGKADNNIGPFTIYNRIGEDVTSHFTNVEKVPGILRVDPAPLTVWTGSAEKVYDGTPLVCEDAEIRTVPGYVAEEPVWRNSSVVTQTALGSETMIGICGSVWVHGTNPVTGEAREIMLPAGHRLSVSLADEASEESIVFAVEPLSVDEIPDEILRIYAENSDLAARACEDAGWDPDALQARIDEMNSRPAEETVKRYGLDVPAGVGEGLLTDSSNLRINIDSTITNYNTRVLTREEAHFAPVSLDPSIRVIPDGSQTEVGESENTYTVDWGTVNQNNYTVMSDPGTLTVTPLNLEVNVGGGTTVYNGRAAGLRPYIRYLNGDHAGETVYGTRHSAALPGTVSDVPLRAAGRDYIFTLFTGDTIALNVSGGGTEPGTYQLTGTVTRSTANFECVSLVFSGATLTIRPVPLQIVTGSASKVYDGTPLTSSEVDVQGLLDGDTITVTATGSQTEIGSGSNTYTIDWGSTNRSHYAVGETLGVLTVTALPPPPAKRAVTVTVTGASDTKEYTGSELVVSGYSLSFSDPAYTADDFTFSGTAAAAGTVPGTYPMGLTSAMFTNNNSDFDVTFAVTDGSLTVTKCRVTVRITGNMETKVYNGAEQEASGCTAASSNPAFPEDPADITYTGSGVARGKNVGTYPMGLKAADFVNSNDCYDVTFDVTDGSLTVTEATLTISTGDETDEYDGTPLPKNTDLPVVSGFIGGDGDYATVEPLYGQLTDAGSAPNRYSIVWTDDTVSANYTISENLGTLTVNPADVIVTLNSYNFVYDGDPVLPDGMFAEYGNGSAVSPLETVFDENVLISSFSLLNGEVLKITCAGFSDAGSWTFAPEYTVTGGNAANYAVSFMDTDITISPSEVELWAQGTFTYDGSPHYGELFVFCDEENYAESPVGGTEADCKNWEVLGPGGAEMTVTLPEYTDAGVYTPTPSYVLTSGTPGNYSVDAASYTLTINPAPVIVTVTGNTATGTYDGTEHSAEGYTVSIDNPLYKEADFSFSGTASVKRTDAGTTAMGLASEQFTNKNPNFTVTFVVTDGFVKLDPRPVSVTVTGHTDTVTYDGESHTVSGYDVSVPADSSYDTGNIVFSGTASVSGTDANTYAMGLASGLFTNTDGNYAVTFSVTDGFVKIDPRPVSVTVTGHTNTVTYNGAAHTVSDYDVSVPADSSYNTGNITFSGTASVSGTNANTYAMGLASGLFTNTDGNYDVNFSVTDGTLRIDPAPLNVTTGSASKQYDGTPLTKSEASLTGLVAGETATVTATGSATHGAPGDSPNYNTYAITWGTANENNYTIVENLGVLTITPMPVTLSGTYHSHSNVYDLEIGCDYAEWSSVKQSDGQSWIVTCIPTSDTFTVRVFNTYNLSASGLTNSQTYDFHITFDSIITVAN